MEISGEIVIFRQRRMIAPHPHAIQGQGGFCRLTATLRDPLPPPYGCFRNLPLFSNKQQKSLNSQCMKIFPKSRFTIFVQFQKPWSSRALVISIILFSISFNLTRFFELKVDIVVSSNLSHYSYYVLCTAVALVKNILIHSIYRLENLPKFCVANIFCNQIVTY